MASDESSFRLACPWCGSELELRSPLEAVCGAGHQHYRREQIWRFLPQERSVEERAFGKAYRRVRREERWGSGDPSYYTDLPFRDLSGEWPAIWRLRSASFRVFERRVVAKIEREAEGRLRILDLGAGNGWLSYRLALRGHEVMAVDLSTDPLDGLGAHVHYPTSASFVAVQASFDHLPLTAAQADLIVFNGSLHYSRNYRASLAEALRVLSPRGRVIVMDSPIYRHRHSGNAMMAEKRARHSATDAAPNVEEEIEGFLTYGQLERLQRDLGLNWRIHRPFYGVDWWLRPWKNRLMGRRESMRLHLLEGRTESA